MEKENWNFFNIFLQLIFRLHRDKLNSACISSSSTFKLIKNTCLRNITFVWLEAPCWKKKRKTSYIPSPKEFADRYGITAVFAAEGIAYTLPFTRMEIR